MKRRDTIKTILAGSLAGGTVATGLNSCKTEQAAIETSFKVGIGRTAEELEMEKRLFEEEYLTDTEISDLAILSDIILPANATAAAASVAKVPEFIAFMVKDVPSLKIPIRGGIAWINNEARKRFEKSFNAISESQRMQIVDDIAFPDKVADGMEQGAKFFDRLRGLVLTGYYTSEEGFKDLGYVGNRPNAWDGVPEEVLKDHDVEYDPEWIAKCVNQERRMEIAEWDENGNLLNN